MTNELRLFGTAEQTRTLILLGLLEESYARELARLSGASLYSTQRLIDKMEQSGVVVTRIQGATRYVRFNPRFYAIDELRALLQKLATQDPAYLEMAASLRKRPRKRGKAI